MAYPTYDEFVTKESWEVRDAYRKRTKHEPAISDMAHNSWRRLDERWTHRDIIHDILGEPLEDGGSGGDKDPEPLPPPLPAVKELFTSSRIFRVRETGEAWRWKGATAFPLIDQFLKGQDITPFLAYWSGLGFNVLRTFPLGVDAKDWGASAWGPCRAIDANAFMQYVAGWGFYTELSLVTTSDPAQVALVQPFLDGLDYSLHPFVELYNEPNVGPKARGVFTPRGVWWNNGEYDDTRNFRGTYGTAHTPRDSEHDRKCHDLMEYFNGGGPHDGAEPAVHVPWVGDEPKRPDQFGFDPIQSEGYFAGCAILGAGATFHYEGGKHGQLPQGGERACAEAAARGLQAFPADAPLGPYSRIDEPGQTLRTYKVGPYVVRIRPTNGIVIPAF